MSLDQTILSAVEIYVRVAEARSFRRGAMALGLTPSAASKAISRLEARLGLTLLERSTRDVRLTAEGVTLLAHGRRALEEIGLATATLSRAREGVAGTVHVEAVPFIAQSVIGPALPALLRRHPQLVVHLVPRDPPRDPDGTVDLVVRLTPPRREQLVVRRVGTLGARVLLCASPSYLARAGTPRRLEDLDAHACLGFLLHDRVEPWIFPTPEGPHAVIPKGPLASTSKEVLVDAAMRGVGIVLAADRMVTSLLRAGALETVLDAHATVVRQPVFVVRASGRYVPKRTRAVQDFLLGLFADDDG